MPIERIRSLLILLFAFSLAACGGGGGGGGGGESCGSGATVTVSGSITFDRVPFKTTAGTGLDFVNAIKAPARDIVVELIQASGGGVLKTAVTDAAGAYSLEGPANCSMFVRAKAQMLKTGAAPTWNFRVLNNTNGDALYTLDGSAFTANGNVIRDLYAASGWGGSGYTDTRAAAPFAILDTVYQVKSLILTAKADTAFPALDLYWSTQNRPSDSFCPDTGDIVSSIYITFGPSDMDECTTPTPGRSGIYVLGNYQIGDTDEFDQHVIAHEAGHAFEDKFSRSDSIGGDHTFGDRLDLRVAFGEGWGDAFGAMALNDPVYRDSSSGISADFSINLESGSVQNPGWYSELGVSHILWDVFDPANETGDALSLGFIPIYNVMTGAQSSTNAVTSIFSFADALKAVSPASTAAITALLANSAIFGTDAFGAGESNNGGDASVLPIYKLVSLGDNPSICSTGTAAGFNKLGNRKFLKLVLNSSALVGITLQGAVDPDTPGSVPAIDPDIYVMRQGVVVERGIAEANADREEILAPMTLPAGTYILEVYDSAFVEGAPTDTTHPHCMTVSVAG